MGKTYRHKSRNIANKITKTVGKALPVVNKGLETVGNTAKGVAIKSMPIIEKGVSAVYGTMATGLDLGVKTVTKGLTTKKRRGGSKTKKRRYRKY